MGEHQLLGRWVVITGSNGGIGASLVDLFAQIGANVVACYNSEDNDHLKSLEEISNKYNVEVVPNRFSLSNSDDIKAAYKRISALERPIDVLVNNAGIATGSTFLMTSMVALKDVFEVNYFGTLAFTQLICRSMIRGKSGSIVNVVSTAGLRGDRGTLAYGSSKAAMIQATRVLAHELAPFGIRVNAIAPGPTQTKMLEKMDPKARQGLIDASALKRVASPSEIAQTILFLAGAQSSFMTGQVMCVDGGML